MHSRGEQVSTPRLLMRPLSLARARVIVSAGDRLDDWADGFPTEGDLVVAGLIVAGCADPEPPWCAYELVERATGLSVGGAGFKGPPRLGRVEIGYGLAPVARGRGLAGEAVAALLSVAGGDIRVLEVEAETEPGNRASQRVLLRAGFTPAGGRSGMVLFRCTVPA